MSDNKMSLIVAIGKTGWPVPDDNKTREKGVKKRILALVAAGVVALGGCTAINQQLDGMQAKREAGEKYRNDMTFKYVSDMGVAKNWYPAESLGVPGTQLIRVEQNTIEYVLAGESTTDFEKLAKPLVDKYLAEVKQRGGVLKAYKPSLHAKVVAVVKMWRTKDGDVLTVGNRNYINGAGKLYIEYSPAGEMRSMLIRTGYGVVSQGYSPTYEKALVAVVFGQPIKGLESQLKNSELKDAEIGGAL